ncbi:PPM-type phosphatase domain containing protein [Paracoccaceae bacterium]
MIFDPESSTGRIVQAGHPYPLHVASDGKVTFLGRGGVPIGVTGLPEYEEIPVTLDPGDRLIVFSDGLYDLRDRHGESFGEERLEALVSWLARTGTIDLVPAIVKHLQC